MKNLLSRTGTADPVLAAATSCPSIRSRIPEHDDLPPVEELVKQALASRTDLLSEKESEAAAAVSNLGTRNGILPFAVVGGNESAGRYCRNRPARWTSMVFTVGPNPYFVGGIGTALGQVFRRDFPSESGYAGLRNGLPEPAGAGRLCRSTS